MKKAIRIHIFSLVCYSLCSGGFNHSGLVFSGGVFKPMYLGYGDGNNHFSSIPKPPGFQFELAANSGKGFEWIFYGISYASVTNIVGTNKIPVRFFCPYYTEFIFYQNDKKNPLFWLLGYDYIRMRFPDTKYPDSHHNITFGGGWNLGLADRLYFQMKIKPYFIIGNSIGQWFGLNIMFNLHILAIE